MPKKYYRKKRYKRRYKKRYSKKRRWMSKISYLKLRSPTNFPDQLYVKFKFRQQNHLVDTLSRIGTQTYSMNSLFDPDVTGVGAQPLGYDQWSQFYTNYQVLGCKITIQGLSNSGSLRQCVVLYPSTNSSPITTIPTTHEQRYSKYKYIPSITSGQLAYVSNYMSIKKIEGRVTSDLEYTGTMGNIGFGASPVKQFFWQIFAYQLDPALTQINIFVTAQITYYAKLFNPIALGPS